MSALHDLIKKDQQEANAKVSNKPVDKKAEEVKLPEVTATNPPDLNETGNSEDSKVTE